VKSPAFPAIRCALRFPDTVVDPALKTLTVRLPEALIAQIEVESWRRRSLKSDVVSERSTGTIGGTACAKIGGPFGIGVDTSSNGQH
jgi:hypothetical protein